MDIYHVHRCTDAQMFSVTNCFDQRYCICFPIYFKWNPLTGFRTISCNKVSREICRKKHIFTNRVFHCKSPTILYHYIELVTLLRSEPPLNSRKVPPSKKKSPKGGGTYYEPDGSHVRFLKSVKVNLFCGKKIRTFQSITLS